MLELYHAPSFRRNQDIGIKLITQKTNSPPEMSIRIQMYTRTRTVVYTNHITEKHVDGDNHDINDKP